MEPSLYHIGRFKLDTEPITNTLHLLIRREPLNILEEQEMVSRDAIASRHISMYEALDKLENKAPYQTIIDGFVYARNMFAHVYQNMNKAPDDLSLFRNIKGHYEKILAQINPAHEELTTALFTDNAEWVAETPFPGPLPPGTNGVEPPTAEDWLADQGGWGGKPTKPESPQPTPQGVPKTTSSTMSTILNLGSNVFVGSDILSSPSAPQIAPQPWSGNVDQSRQMNQ